MYHRRYNKENKKQQENAHVKEFHFNVQSPSLYPPMQVKSWSGEDLASWLCPFRALLATTNAKRRSLRAPTTQLEAPGRQHAVVHESVPVVGWVDLNVMAVMVAVEC